MTAQEQRNELDVLVRHVQQATKDSGRSPELEAALEAGQQAANVGIDVAPALEALKAAWGPPVEKPERKSKKAVEWNEPPEPVA